MAEFFGLIFDREDGYIVFSRQLELLIWRVSGVQEQGVHFEGGWSF